LSGVRDTLDGIKKELTANLVSPSPKKQEKLSPADLAKKFGGKAL